MLYVIIRYYEEGNTNRDGIAIVILSCIVNFREKYIVHCSIVN